MHDSIFHPHSASPSLYTSLPKNAGIGLKPEHFQEITHAWPKLGFFEIHAENYLVAGGNMHHFLTQIRERYPLSIHGVGLSIGGHQALDIRHLNALRGLLKRYQPASFSEHLAWSTHGPAFLNDLLPIPYTQETLLRVCAHVDQTQTFLERKMLLENPATYLTFEQSSYSETQFITEVVKRTGCGMLLDINNAYVSCSNHGLNPIEYLENLPLSSAQELHLAGFHRQTDSLGSPLLIDSHGSPVDQAVWKLYEWVISKLGKLPTLIEWDNDVPTIARFCQEATQAEMLMCALENPMKVTS